MKLKFEIELEVPEAEDYARDVYSYIYEYGYYEDDRLGYQLIGKITSLLEDNWIDVIGKQIPETYRKQYEYTLNSLKY